MWSTRAPRSWAITNQHGPASIESHTDEALAVPGLLAEVRAAEARGADGFVIACFGDPGLDAAREIASGPVVGIAEAGFHAATMLGRSFSVVTTLARTIGQAEHLVHRYGFADKCRSIYACEVAGARARRPGLGRPQARRRLLPARRREGRSRLDRARLRGHGRLLSRGLRAGRRARDRRCDRRRHFRRVAGEARAQDQHSQRVRRSATEGVPSDGLLRVRHASGRSGGDPAGTRAGRPRARPGSGSIRRSCDRSNGCRT